MGSMNASNLAAQTLRHWALDMGHAAPVFPNPGPVTWLQDPPPTDNPISLPSHRAAPEPSPKQRVNQE